MITESIFLEQGIVKGKDTKALNTFNTILPDFRTLSHLSPSNYVSHVWNLYEASGINERDINGKVFEYILISLLINENILPIYVQAKVAFVPNVDFDLLLYSREKPIVLSAKTSLRERYKQADLEAIALKYVHRKAESFLLTLNVKEAVSVNEKIRTGGVIGINNVVIATDSAIDNFISYLHTLTFEEAGSIDIITASSIVNP